MQQRLGILAIGVATLIVAACSGSGGTSPMASSVASGGHSTTIVASGSGGSVGGGGGYGMVHPLSDTYYFNPVPDTVSVGTVVTFSFMDVAHTVTFDQSAGPIADIPATANADSTRVFATAGTYTYHCSIHTYMHGTVVAQ
jgi:plastocyanin